MSCYGVSKLAPARMSPSAVFAGGGIGQQPGVASNLYVGNVGVFAAQVPCENAKHQELKASVTAVLFLKRCSTFVAAVLLLRAVSMTKCHLFPSPLPEKCSCHADSVEVVRPSHRTHQGSGFPSVCIAIPTCVQ